MITGECRVDAIPPSDGQLAGQQLSIKGLRLRLDLRIVPGPAGADGSAAAVLRVENANVSTSPLFGLSVPLMYRRAAVISSLVALAFALLVWFGGSPPGSSEVTAPEGAVGAQATPRVARPAVAPDRSRGDAASGPLPASPPAGSPGSAGAGSLQTAPLAARPPVVPVPAPPATAPLSAPPRTALPAARPVTAPAVAQPPAVRVARPAPAHAGGRADRLDLFADTK